TYSQPNTLLPIEPAGRMSAEPTLQARDIRVLHDEQVVVDGIDLQVLPGEFIVVRGESGCGKTTLIHALSGLLSLASGSVSAMGEAVVPATAHRLRREVLALMTQDLHLLGALDPIRNAALPLLLAGIPAEKAKAQAAQLLSTLGLDVDNAPRTSRLSRGQRQRVALARALVHPRPILLLDEPTSSLDPSTRDAVLDILTHRAQEGASVLVTSHDETLSQHANRTLLFSNGRVEPQ
ncbi:MAG: ABC transporter ATP-binding protein, partial [Myxococcota bacterium]|nr:ABC transporter ATP-binding protein [Myxococcota bacterium]